MLSRLIESRSLRGSVCFKSIFTGGWRDDASPDEKERQTGIEISYWTHHQLCLVETNPRRRGRNFFDIDRPLARKKARRYTSTLPDRRKRMSDDDCWGVSAIVSDVSVFPNSMERISTPITPSVLTYAPWICCNKNVHKLRLGETPSALNVNPACWFMCNPHPQIRAPRIELGGQKLH